VQKHVAQTCIYITLADSQAFYQISVFNSKSKTHNLQTWKYDVSVTSAAAKNI